MQRLTDLTIPIILNSLEVHQFYHAIPILGFWVFNVLNHYHMIMVLNEQGSADNQSPFCTFLCEKTHTRSYYEIPILGLVFLGLAPLPKYLWSFLFNFSVE